MFQVRGVQFRVGGLVAKPVRTGAIPIAPGGAERAVVPPPDVATCHSAHSERFRGLEGRIAHARERPRLRSVIAIDAALSGASSNIARMASMFSGIVTDSWWMAWKK